MVYDEVSTISTKGAVIIPTSLRKRYNIKPGDRVVWIQNENGELLLKRFKGIEIHHSDL